jgi:ribosome-associated heat shock protein Hsp15
VGTCASTTGPPNPRQRCPPGDEVRARVGSTIRIVEVVRVIQKRVGPADAAICFIDRTPPPPTEPPVAHRDRGAGRPTKRERRILDKFRTGQS